MVDNAFLEALLQKISEKSGDYFKRLHTFIHAHLKFLTSQDTADTAKDDLIAYAMQLGYLERGDTPKEGNCLFHCLENQFATTRNSVLDLVRHRGVISVATISKD